MNAPPLARDTVVDGRYLVREHLATGGMGHVYRARDREGRLLAMKILGETSVRAAEARFLNEAWLLEAIRHPNVVRFLRCGRAAPHRYLAMEYIHGESVADRLGRGPLPVSDAVSVADQVLAALEAVHAQGVIHRDVTPHNVLLDEASPYGVRAVLIDFGLAKASDHALTAAGVFLGSPGFAATEQLEGRHLDRRTDLFAVGALLYTMLTGRRPYQGETAREVRYQHRLAHPPRPSAYRRRALPEGLDELVMRLMDTEASRRPRSALEARAALSQLRVARLAA